MNEQADYQSDLLFHGLRSILGENCVDIPKKDYMYDTYDEGRSKELWGSGFTYSRTLPEINIDRNVDYRSFDAVVFSVHHSLQSNFDLQCQQFLDMGVPRDRIAVVDGHDWPIYNSKLADIAPLYFKRELDDLHTSIHSHKHIRPIWFAIPKEKIVNSVPDKKRDFARIYPGAVEWGPDSRKTHTFINESDYYREYQESRFAFTCKKGGWDCMRHYEIMANGCIPIFTDIERCPSKTCFMLNVPFLSLMKTLDGLHLPHKGESLHKMSPCYSGKDALFGQEKWEGLERQVINNSNQLLNMTKSFGTTEYLAEYFLKECKWDTI